MRGLDPTCPSTIKREPSSPSSQGDVSPAHPSPGSSSSDTNSSYGALLKGHHVHGNGLDSPGLYAHAPGSANSAGANRSASRAARLVPSLVRAQCSKRVAPPPPPLPPSLPPTACLRRRKAR